MPNFRHKPNAGWAVRIIRREFHMCLEQKERTVARDARVKERWCIRTGRSIIVYANYQRRPSFRKLFTSHLRIARRVWKKVGRQWASLEGRAVEGSSITRGMNLPGKTAKKRGLYEIRSDCASDRINLLPPVNRFPREDKNL